MIEIFPLGQWIAVGLVGLVFGLFTLKYLTSKPILFLVFAGSAFFLSRVVAEFQAPERVLGAALLWLFFVLAIAVGDKVSHRRFL